MSAAGPLCAHCGACRNQIRAVWLVRDIDVDLCDVACCVAGRLSITEPWGVGFGYVVASGEWDPVAL